jgi:cytoskeletal protein CcmA (bactofilin family)
VTKPAPAAAPPAAPPPAAATPPPVAPADPDPQKLTTAPLLRPSLGSDTSISGRLSFTGPTRIDGRLRGEVRANELLVVGEDAIVEGVVRAAQLVVLGEVRGDVRGAESVEIARGGRLMGSVEAQSLVVREGGYLDGDCRIAPPRAALRVVQAPAVGA